MLTRVLIDVRIGFGHSDRMRKYCYLKKAGQRTICPIQDFRTIGVTDETVFQINRRGLPLQRNRWDSRKALPLTGVLSLSTRHNPPDAHGKSIFVSSSINCLEFDSIGFKQMVSEVLRAWLLSLHQV